MPHDLSRDDDLSRSDWDTLKDIGRGLFGAALDRARAERLIVLDLARAAEDGRLGLTELGRRAVLLGSPRLWSSAA